MIGNPRPAVTNYVAEHQINEGTFPSLAVLVDDIGKQVAQYGSFAKVPSDSSATPVTTCTSSPRRSAS